MCIKMHNHNHDVNLISFMLKQVSHRERYFISHSETHDAFHQGEGGGSRILTLNQGYLTESSQFRRGFNSYSLHSAQEYTITVSGNS